MARSRNALLFLIFTILLGMVAFSIAEDLNVMDSLYFTVITMTTVGFGDIVPSTPAGRILAVIIAPMGLVAVFGIGISMVEEQLRHLYLTGGARSMEKRLARLRDHFIVCGYGRLGSNVASDLENMKQEVVVIDKDAEKTRQIKRPYIIPLVGDALRDDTLRTAGISRARGLIATFSEDTNNVYVVLEARDLRQDLEIVSTASNQDAARRLYLAGATRVVSPNLVGAEMLAKSAVNPAVLQLMSRLTDPKGITGISQIVVSGGSKLDGVTLQALRQMGIEARVILIRNGDNTEFFPKEDSRIEKGSVIVVACNAEDLEVVEKAATG